MSAVVVIVGDELGQKPPEMSLVQGEDVVQQLPSASAHPAFCDPVLPRTLERSLDSSDVHRLYGFRNFQPILCVPIQEKEPTSGLVGKRFP
jgi:hypothetical protein